MTKLEHEKVKESFGTKVAFFILRMIVGPLIRKIWIKKVDGLDNIPTKGSVIFAFNHSSYFDFISFLSVSPRNLHYLAAEVFFDSKMWRPLMIATGQIEVRRNATDKAGVHSQVRDYLKKGHAIGIFPEGTRAPTEEMIPAFNGAVKYATEHKVPIIPVGLKGTYKVMSRHDKIPRFKKIIEISVGKPITYEQYSSSNVDESTIHFLTDTLMDTIARLAGKTFRHFKVLKNDK